MRGMEEMGVCGEGKEEMGYAVRGMAKRREEGKMEAVRGRGV